MAMIRNTILPFMVMCTMSFGNPPLNLRVSIPDLIIKTFTSSKESIYNHARPYIYSGMIIGTTSLATAIASHYLGSTYLHGYMQTHPITTQLSLMTLGSAGATAAWYTHRYIQQRTPHMRTCNQRIAQRPPIYGSSAASGLLLGLSIGGHIALHSNSTT